MRIISSDRQFYLIKRNNRAFYVLGTDIYDVAHVELPSYDLSWHETVIHHRREMPVTLYGHETTIGHFTIQENLENIRLWGVITGTAELTEGKQGKPDDGLAIAFAAFMMYSSRRTLAASKHNKVREVAAAYIDEPPQEFMDSIMDLTVSARKKFVIKVFDWLQVLGAFSYKKRKIIITVRNNIYRLIFQALLYDIGSQFTMKLTRDYTKFVFPWGYEISKLRKPDYRPKLEVKTTRLKGTEPVLDRNLLIYRGDYLGNNMVLRSGSGEEVSSN